MRQRRRQKRSYKRIKIVLMILLVILVAVMGVVWGQHVKEHNQSGIEAALSDEGISACVKNINYYKENAKLITDLLDEKGIFYTGGSNSPYVWLECPEGVGSWEFFDKLLNEVQIVGTPGEGFGKGGDRYFRITAFGSRENTMEAVERLRNIL